MKFILEYKSYTPKFEVGDVVLIRYWYLKEEECPNELRKKIPYTPVTIKEMKNGRFLVSHDTEGSLIPGAPDERISKSQILDHRR